MPKNYALVPGDDPLCPACFARERGYCMYCGEPGGTFVEPKGVQGMIFASRYGSRLLFLCPACTRLLVMKSLVFTSFWGWWGAISFILSIRAQALNLRSLWTASDMRKAAFPPVALLAFWFPIAAAAAIAAAIAFSPGSEDGARTDEAAALAEEGRVELSAGRFESAAGKFFQAVQARPEYAAYRFELGFALFKTGRLEDAEIQIRRGIELRVGKTPREVMLLAEIAAEKGRHAEAAGLYRAAIDEASDPEFGSGAPAPLLQSLLCQAHRGYQDAKRESAPRELASEYMALAERNPGSALHLYLLARVEENRAAAEKLYAESSALDPDFFEPAYALAYSRMEAGNLEMAASDARDLARRWPGRPQAGILLAEILAASGDLDGAGAAYANLGRIKSFEPQAEAGRGAVAAMKGRFAEAEGVLRGAIGRLAAKDYWRDFASLWLGLALRCQGKDPSVPLAAAAASRTRAVAAAGTLWLGEYELSAGRDPRGTWKKGFEAAPSSFEGIVMGMLSAAAPAAEYAAAVRSPGHARRRPEALYFESLRRRIDGDDAGARELLSAAASAAAEGSVVKTLASGRR